MFAQNVFLCPAFRCHAISNRCCRSGTTPITSHLKVSSRWMSTTHSETHCNRHDKLQTALREVVEILRKFCANFAEIVDIFRNLVLLRQRRLRKFCGNSLKCAENFRREVGVQNPTSRCMRQCELQKFRKGGVRRFERKGAQNCAQICTQIGNQFRTSLCKYPFSNAPISEFLSGQEPHVHCSVLEAVLSEPPFDRLRDIAR